MGSPFDAFPEASGAPQPPAAPKAMAASIWDAYPEAPKPPASAPREASGFVESLQAGFQASAPGLAWRGKLPDLVVNPEHAKWWERAASGVGQIGAELPLMIGGAIAGAPVGTAVGGPVGTLLGAGFGMGAVPAAIRTTLMEAYKEGGITTGEEFWNALREVATQTVKEGGINAAAMGAGAVAKGALAMRGGATSEAARAIALGSATPLTRGGAALSEGVDIATQIATMTTMPAAMQGRLPSIQEIMDAAILIGGLKAAHVTATRIMSVYEKTGKTPAEQVADAQRDPKVAEDLTKPPEPKPGPDVPRETDGRVAMPSIQEALFRETARIDELELKARADATPLSDAERVELVGLKAKVSDLEAQLSERAKAPAANVADIVDAKFTDEQLAGARKLADDRIQELTTKAESGALTDTERTERIFLTNSLDKPGNLAKHFAIEPAGKLAPTPEAREASAQRVFEDVLGQVKAADDARRASGLAPLGEEHAQAVAALVRARVRTRAARLGVLPEDIYNEKPLQIRDETSTEVAAAEAAIPPEAPRFLPPEVDLFGNPVEVTNAPRYAVENMATTEVPLANLVLSKEVPQFKNAADAQGVVIPLGGKFDRTGVGPIQVWERLDGTLEVISGRHRLDLARRSGEETIPAQIHREADGFDARQAATLDAQLNIREEQGSVADYAQYFKDSGLSKEAADERGLLARAKGRTGFAIARDASPDLLAAHRAGRLSDEAALSISTAAPGSERLQALGIAQVNEGKSILFAVNTMKAVDLMAAERMAAGAQGDIFGFDDSAMREAAAMAKKASSKQRAISEQISAVSGASKRPELARKLGVDVQDPEGIQKKIVELKQEQYLWDNWPLYPELVAKLRDQTLKQGPVNEEFALAADTVDGRVVREHVPNMSSISASLTDYKVLPGIREIPLSAFDQEYVPENSERVRNLVDQINESGEINPLIVVKDKDGLYILEGGHRYDALKLMGAKALPAKLVIDRDGMPAMPEPFELKPETPSEAAKRDEEAVAQAQRKMMYHGGTYRPGEKLTRPLFLTRNPEMADSYVDMATDRGMDGAIRMEVSVDLRNSAPEKVVRAEAKKLGISPDSGTPASMFDGELHGDDAVRKLVSALQKKGYDHAELGDIAYGKQISEPVVIAFPGAKIKAANPNILFQSDPKTWWYSALARGVDTAQMKAAPAQGWKDWLKGQTGKGAIKADEIKWSGLEEWLDLQPGRVTKEQVADYLKSGGVRVEEKMLGGEPNAQKRIDAALEGTGYRVETRPEIDEVNVPTNYYGPDGREIDFIDLPPEIRARIEVDDVVAPKFSTYQLPGAKQGTYRELLLTLPVKRTWVDGSPVTAEDLSTEHGRAAADRVAGVAEGTFSGSHHGVDNVLAHIRFNERTDADGKRVLFVEEIQSDWAQKGRDQGFEPKQVGEIIVRLKEGGAIYRRFAADDAAEARALIEQNPELEMVDSTRTIPAAIPAAPFVTKTDSWVQLSMKRMIRYAAENGFDKIAWTRGEQQVDRYTSALRKAVDVVEWKKTEEGIQLVGYKGRGSPDAHYEAQQLRDDLHQIDQRLNNTLDEFGDPHEMDPAVRAAYQADVDERAKIATALAEATVNPRHKVVDTTEKESALSDAIGKSMAEKIIKDPNQSGTIEGKDIKIDDTGMAGFYDRMLPSIAKEVLKKLGGGKVGEVEIDGTVERTEPDGSTMRIIGNEKHQGFDITPAMRDKAMEGLPLFQNETQPRGSFQVAEHLITTMAGADKSTVPHELGHSWLEELKIDAAREDAPAQIKQDWGILRHELGIGEDGTISRASHEQWARTVERYLADGVAPTRELQGVFDRFKTWLLEIYNSLGNLKAEVNPELKAVLDRMLATDEELAMAKELGVPRAYVPEANAARIAAIVPPEQARAKIQPGFEAERASMEPFTDELPTGPGEAPDTTRVNYEYINAPEDVKRAMQGLAEIDQANIQKRRGGVEGVESWEATNEKVAQEMADVLEGDPRALDKYVNDVLGASATQPKVNEVLRRMKVILTGAAKDSAARRDVILSKGLDASIKEQLEYLGSLERLRMIQNEFLGQRAAVARALNQLKDTTEGTGEVGRMLEAIGVGADEVLLQSGRTPEQEQAAMKMALDEILLRYKDKSGNIRTPLDIAKLHKEIGTLKGSFKLAEAMEKAGKWEKFVEGWKAGLLSGPQTPVVNLFGTASFEFMRPAVDALSAIIGMARGASPGMGETDRASMSEAVARLTGMVGGIQDGLKVGYAALKVDQQTGKVESYRPAIEGKLGEIIRMPYRLMAAGDQVTTTMYSRGEIASLAIRQAFDEGLSPGGREFAERVQALKDKPTPEMQAIADEAAARMTFNSPGGEKMRAVQTFVSKWNLEWMVPFIRTPMNVAEEMLRMSPFAPAVTSWRADIAKGGVARDRAIAELTLGAGIMALTTAYAFSGQISGSGSPDPGKNRAKAGVWQANSWLIGDTWYEYGRIQPVGTLMALAADMATTWDMMNDEERDKIPKMLALAFSNAITNQTFLQGITNVVHLMSEPDRYGGRFLQGLAGSMVPNVIGQPTAMSDPYVRQVNSMLDAVQSRIPGLRQELAPKVDWLGEPTPTKERVGVVGPSRTQKVSDDPVRKEAKRLNISVADAPKKTHIGKGTGNLGDVELTPEERTKFAEVGGKFAHDILANIVTAPGYDAIPDMVKKRIFSKVLSASHKIAAVAALPPDKRMQYLQSITEKVAQELTPEAE